MPTTSLLQKKKSELVDLSYHLAMAATEGEDFHKEYTKDKEAFRLLIRSQNKLERNLRKYFAGFARRLQYEIDWYSYDLKRLSASVDDWINVDWQKERVTIKVTLNDALVDALRAGGNKAEDEFKIDVDWDPESEAFNKYLDNYSLKLAGQLNETSHDRLVTAIRNSLANKETIEEATARIDRVIDDPKRAARIARTESIKAFAEGRVAAGKMMGATHKEWSATLKRCPICAAMDGQIVKIDEDFRHADLRLPRPPAHPNCRCYVRLLFKED